MRKHFLNFANEVRLNPVLFSCLVLVIFIAVLFFNLVAASTTTIPLAPSDLRLSDTSSTTFITLRWNDNSDNEEKFIIEKKPSADSIWSIVNQTTITEYTDTAVSPGIFYDYRVRACLSGVGCSNYTILEGISIFVANSGGTTTTISTNTTAVCSSLSLTQNDGKNTYFVGEFVNYTWTCFPLGTISNNVYVWLKKTDGVTMPYSSGSGGSTQTLSIGTSSLIPGTYVLLTCFDSLCTNIVAHTTFTLVFPTVISTQSDTTTPTTITTTSAPSDLKLVDTSSTTETTITQNTSISPNTDSSSTPTTSTSYVDDSRSTILNQTNITNSTIKPSATPITAPVDQKEALSQFQDIGTIIETITNEIENTRKRLVEIVDQDISQIIIDAESSKKIVNLPELNSLRDKLVGRINSKLDGSIDISSTDLKNLENEINYGLNTIRTAIFKEDNTFSQTKVSLDALIKVIQDQSPLFKSQNGDLFYKDSNKDGISDHDSIYVYNIDPKKSSPVTKYEGKTINAGEKVLLGFDPTKSELVSINKEQPTESIAPVIPIYKVNEVNLTAEKKVSFTGKALPNSFLTLYIYSTPIIVTIKTDSDGEWQYTMDKELENGTHTVYTATVNNTGKIMVKSPGFTFVKTAEAATLEDFLPINTEASQNKPGLLSGIDATLVLSFISLTMVLVLILVGIISKKKTPPPLSPPNV